MTPIILESIAQTLAIGFTMLLFATPAALIASIAIDALAAKGSRLAHTGARLGSIVIPMLAATFTTCVVALVLHNIALMLGLAI